MPSSIRTPSKLVPFNSVSGAACNGPTPDLGAISSGSSCPEIPDHTYCFDETEYEALLDKAFWED